MLTRHEYEKYRGPSPATDALRDRVMVYLDAKLARDQKDAEERQRQARTDQHEVFAAWLKEFGITLTDDQREREIVRLGVEGFLFEVHDPESGSRPIRVDVSRPCAYCGAQKFVATLAKFPTPTYPYDHLITLAEAIRAEEREQEAAESWRASHEPHLSYSFPCECHRED